MGRTRSQLSAQLKLVDWDRLYTVVILGVLAAALCAGIPWVAHRCDNRFAPFAPIDVFLELRRQHLDVTRVRDPAVTELGGTIFESRIGRTGIVAIVWPSFDEGEQSWPHNDERVSLAGRWERRLILRYEQAELNVTFYTLRGGSEADRSRVRDAISRASSHLNPAPPPDCPSDP